MATSSRYAGGREAVLRLGLFVCLVSGFVGCRPPQVLDDDECFKAVDALWTAVTARSPELLTNAFDELSRLHASGQLSEEGYESLARIVVVAEEGNWEPAARQLKAFIQGQRRGNSK